MQNGNFTKYRDVINESDEDEGTSGQISEISESSCKMTQTVEELKSLIVALQDQNAELFAQIENLKKEKTNPDNLSLRSENTESSNLNSIKMKELKSQLEVITEFDGNNISVETFIFEIKSVFNNVPEDSKALFTRLIISKKIVRHARKMIDGYDIRSVEDLFHTLRINFGENKSYDVALLERSQCQQSNDSVLNYNKKFNECHLNVKRAVNNNSEFNAENRALILKNEERQGLAHYIRGLRASIKLFVKASKPTTIREAQNLALETEKEEVMSHILYKKAPNNNDRASNKSHENKNPKSKNQTHSQKPDGKNKFPCHNCGSFEHYIKDCPSKRQTVYQNFPSRRVPNTPPNQIKYTQCQETEETQEQASCSESKPLSDNEIIHSWQTQEQQ